jgi:hypothetical protein
MNIKRITLEVPIHIYDQIKALSFVERRPISSIAREALKNHCLAKGAEMISIIDQRS